MHIKFILLHYLPWVVEKINWDENPKPHSQIQTKPTHTRTTPTTREEKGRGLSNMQDPIQAKKWDWVGKLGAKLTKLKLVGEGSKRKKMVALNLLALAFPWLNWLLEWRRRRERDGVVACMKEGNEMKWGSVGFCYEILWNSLKWNVWKNDRIWRASWCQIMTSKERKT